MRTAKTTLIMASLLAAGCSGGVDGENSPDLLVPATNGSASSTAPATLSTVPGVMNSTSSTAVGVPSGSPSAVASVAPQTSSTGEITDPPPPPVGACEPGVPNTTQVPRMTMRQYDGAMRDLLNVTTVGAAASPSLLSGLQDNRGAMTSTEWNGYQATASAIAKQVLAGADKALFMACDTTAPDCLETTIRDFGRKAFRRPLTDMEVAMFLEFDNLDPKGTPAEVAEAILTAFLISPSFLMMPELSDVKDAAGTSYTLTPYETATRLATLIWRSVPDDILLDAAEAGQLATPAQILSQAERMIAVTAKSGALLADYHRFYADIRDNAGHWNRTVHDEAKLPQGVTAEALSKSMMSEVDAFFAEVAAGGAFKDLFLSPVAYVNQDTAAIYGLDPANFGAELTRVELSGTERPGFLTRVGFLSSFSNYSKTSPILRGAFIGQNMLGAPAVAPKEGVPTEPPVGVYMTRREEVDALTAPDDCAACHHVSINPPGYVMEAFDTVGRIQTTDPLGGAINTSADVQVDGTIKTINNPLELMQAIATGASGQRRYAERWVEYATGRSPNRNDQCAVDSIAMKLSADGTYTIVKLLADLSQTEPFTLRTVGN